MARHGKRAPALIFAALLVASPAFAQSISTQANSVFRDYNTSGNALSGVYNPPKSDVRSLFGLVDTQIPHTADPHTWAATQTFSVAPVFSDPSGTRSALGLGALATLNAPPAPTTSVLGGVLSLTCSTNQFVNSVNSSGVPTCATPTTGSSTTAAGSSGQFQTNSSGSLAGVAITGDVSISGTTGIATLAATTGAHTFTGNVFAQASVPVSGLVSTSAPSDNKIWFHDVDSVGNYNLVAENDAFTVGNPALRVTRSGATPTGVSLYAPLSLAQTLTSGAPAGPLNPGLTEISRTTSYTGGSGVTPSLHVATSAGAATTDFQWGVLSEMDNFSATSENAAIYGQSRKHGAGPVWGGVFESRDMFATSGNPVNPMWGVEIDVMGYGSDTNNQRRGLEIVYGRHDHTDAAVYHLGTAISINPWPADLAAGKVIVDRLLGAAVIHTPAVNGLDLTGFDFSGNPFQSSGFHVAATGATFIQHTVNSSDQTSYSFSTGTGVGANDLTMGADASNAYIQSWAGKSLALNAQGNAISLGGPVFLYNQASSGTAVGTVCATASGQIFIKTTAGACL